MAKQNKPTAVLVDDHPAVLAAVNSILWEQFEIVASVNDGRQALAAAAAFQPQIIVMDVMMAGWNGFETAAHVRHVAPSTRVLFLSVVEDTDYIAKAREMDAGYVIKRRIGTDLLAAALQTLSGKLFFSNL